MYPDTPNQENYQQLKDLLRQNTLLAEMTESQIEDFAARAGFEAYKQGDIILRQGDVGHSFYFVVDGQLRVIDTNYRPARLMNYLAAGTFFGERALLFDDYRAATVDVAVDAIIAKFDKKTWQWLLDTAPQLVKEFHELEKTYEEHSFIPFSGRQTDEVAIIKTTRHILAYIKTLIGPLILVIFGLVIGWVLTELKVFELVINYGFSAALAVLSVVWAIINYVEWVNDDFIVSSKRVIHIERTIIAGEHREEAPLTQVHDVEVNTPNFFTRFFDYSNVTIKSAGVGSILFDGIKNGEEIKRAIFEQVEHAKERVQASDISAIRKSLAGQVGYQGGPLEPEPLEVVDITNKKREFKMPGLLRYYLPNFREETPIGVTWRKHYLIWLQSIWLPALVGVVAIYLFLASLFGLTPFDNTNLTASLYLGGFLLFNLLWYTYQHDDWHKDIYVVTDTKILHQDSTAFRLRGEETHETTFENVQTINYESPSFISRIFNIGNVIIKTATVGEPFVFENVLFPRDVQQEIFTRWVAFRENQRKRQRASEEDRFTTWLGEYHKMLKQGNTQN